jgi:sugar transferase (PEP-CTERM/EpsH1 system associated)
LEILYISHCVPWPPDKGERIRAHYSLRALMERHQVHLACLARSEREAAASSDLRARCASVRIEVLRKWPAMLRGLARFALGGCLTAAFYDNGALRAHVRAVTESHHVGAAVVLSSAMAPYVPDGLPFLADWGDVDSEKWLQYSRLRGLGFVQRLEAGRLRKIERDYALRSRRTFLTTPNEVALFRRIAPEARVACSGNGVDTTAFDPDAAFAVPDDLRRRKFLVFVGVLDYFPNSDGVCRFAETVFPALRRSDPALELFLVGRDPAPSVERLARLDGVTVTGAVDDVRPYLAASRAVVVPLRIARGIQNKVLEALAMGKRVLASEEVCATFAPDLPPGVIRCASADDYVRAASEMPATAAADLEIAAAARHRFGWSAHLAPILDELDTIERERASLK